MKFENIIFTPGPAKPPLQSPILKEKLLDKKSKIVDEFAPDEMDFDDVYPKADILKDLHQVGTYEGIFDLDDTERAKANAELASLFEAFILDQIYSNNWLGSGMDPVLCSRYDDITNHVDLVINKKSEDPSIMNDLVLGVDITYANNPEVIAKKMNRIKKEIREGEVTKLKYFQDHYNTKYQEIKIPKVVVGISEEEVNRLLRLWVSENNKNEKLQKDETANKILIQIIEQLTYFRDYTTKFIRDNVHTKENINRKGIKKRYDNAIKYFAEVLVEKEIDHANLYKEYDDPVHNQILKEIK